MGWKGRHHRNWIRPGISGWSDEFEVTHEIKSESYGSFGVFESNYDEEWMVFWRPNRNYTTEWKIKVMCEKVEVSYSNYPREEEIKYPTEAAAIASIAHWQKNFLHPPKIKRYRPRDSQKGKVYRWEHIMAFELGAKKLSATGRELTALEFKYDRIHLKMFLNEVCQKLGEEVPVLKFRSGGRHSFGGTEIQLLPCHCNHLILLHELSHVLHKRWGKKTNGKHHQGHGKEFVGIYALMLIRFGDIDKTEIIRHARKHKVNLLLPEQYWEWKETERKAA